jgi:hypothetical protein
MKSLQIDVTLLDKSRFKTITRKNGKTAILCDLVIFDRPDDYGNDGFVTQSLTKDERVQGLKLPILGNSRTVGQSRPEEAPLPKRTVEPHPHSTEEDDIPF